MKEGKQISVRNQKIINLVEVQINDLRETLQVLGKKSSINQFKQYTTKLHSIYGQLQIVFSDQNFSEVYDHIKKLLMNYEILFVSMLERIENFDKIQRGYQKKLQVIGNETTLNKTPQSMINKQKLSTNIKSSFSKQQIKSIQQTIESMKSKRMGGIHLYNQNYIRGIEGKQQKTAQKDKITQKRQFNEETNSLLSQMDEAQIQLRLQSDQIDNYLALRRGKYKMFNHVSYSGDLEEIANFFKETQDEAIDFLNTSKNTTTATQYTQQFNGIMCELKAQKEIQSANVISKINEIVQFIKKRNAEVQASIHTQFQRLKKLKQQARKKKVEAAVQTTHDFTEQIKKLQDQLTEESQKYEVLVNFKQQSNNYQDKYFQLIKELKIKQVQTFKYQVQLRQKTLYIEDLQKKIRLKGNDRFQKTKSPSPSSSPSRQTVQNQKNQQNQKSPSNLGQSGNFDNSLSKSFKKRKSVQISFIKEFGQKRDSKQPGTDSVVPNSKESTNKTFSARQSSLLNSTLEDKKVSKVNSNDIIDQQQQFALSSKPSRKIIKTKPLKKIANPSDKQSTQIASLTKGNQKLPNQHVINSIIKKSEKSHRRQPSIQSQILNRISLKNKIIEKDQPKYQIIKTQKKSEKQINYIKSQQNRQNIQISYKKEEELQQFKSKELEFNAQNSKQCMDYKNRVQSNQQKRHQATYNQQIEQQIDSESSYDSENQQQHQQSQEYHNEQKNCIPSIQKIQQDKKITNSKKNIKQDKNCIKVNIVDIDHSKFEQKYQINQKRQQKKIINKHKVNKSRPDVGSDLKNQEFNLINQSRRKNTNGNKPQKNKDKNYHLKEIQNNLNSSLKTSGKCLNYKNNSNQRLSISGKQKLITSVVSVTIYPFVANTHHVNANFNKKAQQQFQQQFVNIIRKLDKNAVIQQLQYQQQSEKQNSSVSGQIKKKKYSIARQKANTQGLYQVVDVSKRYKIDKSAQLILKKKINKSQLSFTQYSSTVDQNQEFQKLKQVWKQKCYNIQQQKQEVIRKHLASCGGFCMHLQRYLQIFNKFSQNERKTLKMHIENINKYQSHLSQDLEEQKQKMLATNTNKLQKQNKLSLHANTNKMVKTSMMQTIMHQQNKSPYSNFGTYSRDLSLPHIRK